MAQHQLLKMLLLFCLTVGLMQSNAIGQQITAEGIVSTNYMPIQNNLGAFANLDEVFIGVQDNDPFAFASGRITASGGAFLNMNSVVIGGPQAMGIFQAQGIGTTANIQQGLNLVSGSLSVTDGAAVNIMGSTSTFDSLFVPTINVSGVGSLLQLSSTFLDQGTINVSDAAGFSAGFVSLTGTYFQPIPVRINLTNGGQAIIGDFDFGSTRGGRGKVFIDDESTFLVMSNLTIGESNTITLEGGLLFGNNFINIDDSGELRGYGEVASEIELRSNFESLARLTVDADQTLRTLDIRNFSGQISNFGTLDAGNNQIDNVFEGQYLGENSTIRAGLLLNDGKINLIGGRNLVEADMANQGEISVSGGASVFFTQEVNHNGSIHTADGSTSTFLGRLFVAGTFEGAGDVVILDDFNPNNSFLGVVTFEGDLELATSSSTEIELGGTDQFDAFDVDGTLTLGGDLDVVLRDGFELESGQEFIIAEVDNLQVGQFNGLAEGAMVGNFGGTDLFISYVAGDGNDVSLFTDAGADIVLGDANQDGVVDFSDISSFIEILTASTFLEEADVNVDGAVNFSDIPVFIAILTAN